MALIISTMDISEECRTCQFFCFRGIVRGIVCTGHGCYTNTKCYLSPPERNYSHEKYGVEKEKRSSPCPLKNLQKE